MLPLAELVTASLLALGSGLLGLHLGRPDGRRHAIGFGIGGSILGIVGLPRVLDVLVFHPPFVQICGGKGEQFLMAAAVPLIFGMTARRLRAWPTKVVILVTCMWVTGQHILAPFIAPSLVREKLSRLETRLDQGGICLQTEEYTCGPAAAVTILRRQGIPANEGELAVLAECNPINGTSPWLLESAIESLYGKSGATAEYAPSDSIDALRSQVPAIVFIRGSGLSGHYVAVLEVTDWTLTIGEPRRGLCVLPISTFQEIWKRRTALMIRTGP